MSDYEIGYKKPPKKSQFKKGRSGNPGGRPARGPQVISTDDAEIMRRLDAKMIRVGGVKMTMRAAEIRRLWDLELKGEPRAARLLEMLRRQVVGPARGGVLSLPMNQFLEAIENVKTR